MCWLSALSTTGYETISRPNLLLVVTQYCSIPTWSYTKACVLLFMKLHIVRDIQVTVVMVTNPLNFCIAFEAFEAIQIKLARGLVSRFERSIIQLARQLGSETDWRAAEPSSHLNISYSFFYPCKRLTSHRAIEPSSHRIVYLTLSLNTQLDWRAVEPLNYMASKMALYSVIAPPDLGKKFYDFILNFLLSFTTFKTSWSLSRKLCCTMYFHSGVWKYGQTRSFMLYIAHLPQCSKMFLSFIHR